MNEPNEDGDEVEPGEDGRTAEDEGGTFAPLWAADIDLFKFNIPLSIDPELFKIKFSFPTLDPELFKIKFSFPTLDPELFKIKFSFPTLDPELFKINIPLGIDPELFKIKFSFPTLEPELWKALLDNSRWYPPDWPEQFPNSELLNSILNDEGLPLVWVPRQSLFEKLLLAADRAERVAVLLAHREDLTEDCAAVLGDLTHARLAGQRALALKVMDSYAAGHEEAAQALAVVVIDSAVKAIFTGSYKAIPGKAQINVDDVPFGRLRLLAALAPIGQFYVEWHPSSGDPAPEALSRHVSIHHAAASQYTPENAVLSVLLMTSVLMGAQDYWTQRPPL